MADIVINPSVGKIDFFTTKGDQSAANSLRLTGTTVLFAGPISASSISTGGGGAFVTSVQPTTNYLSKFTGNSTIANSLVYDNGTNVGIGNTSPLEKLHVLGNIHIQSEADSLGGGGLYLGISNSRNISIRQTSTNKNFAVDTYNDSESWQNRITILNSGGALLVGKTVGYGTGTAENNTLQLKSFLVFGSDNTGSASNRNWNISTNGSAAGNMDWTVGSTNTGWPNFAYRLQLTSSGSLNNTTGTYGTISDLRLKENISDARNYLDDLLKLRVVKYSLKEESSDFATKIGFIAQEVEQVFPNLVDQSDVGYDGGEGIRSVKTSILIPMLLKSIQELSVKVKTLESKVQILESK